MQGVIAFCIYDELGDITPTKPKPADTEGNTAETPDPPAGEDLPKKEEKPAPVRKRGTTPGVRTRRRRS
jgi:hypothetical protein